MSDLNTRVSVALDPSGFTSGADKMKTGVDNVTDSLKKLNDAAGQTQIPVNGSIGDFSNIPGGGSYSNQAVLQAQQQSASNAQVQQVQQMSNGSIGSSGNGGGSNGSGGGVQDAVDGEANKLLAAGGWAALAGGIIKTLEVPFNIANQWKKASDVMDTYAVLGGDEISNRNADLNSSYMSRLFKEVNGQRQIDGTKYSNKDYLQSMSRLAEYGYGDSQRALDDVSEILRYQNFGAGSRDQLLSFQGLTHRFGEETNAIRDAYGALRASGMEKGQFNEFLSGLEDVMESGISKGFIRSSKEIGQDLTLLYNLSGKSELWQGQYGAEKLQKMNSALENATNLGSVNDVLMYQAVSGLSEGTKKKILDEDYNKDLGYINDMMILERGITSQNIGSIFKTVKDTGGDAADQIERYKNMFGVTYSTAKQIYDMSLEYNETSASKTASRINKMLVNPENMSKEQQMISTIETISAGVQEMGNVLYGIESTVVNWMSNTLGLDYDTEMVKMEKYAADRRAALDLQKEIEENAFKPEALDNEYAKKIVSLPKDEQHYFKEAVDELGFRGLGMSDEELSEAIWNLIEELKKQNTNAENNNMPRYYPGTDVPVQLEFRIPN